MRITPVNLKPKPLKPFKFPEGFQLLVDSREQLPLTARSPTGLTIITQTLEVGDYSIQGFDESGYVIERKQISDFYSFIGSERPQTTRKIQRMAEFDFAALIIEASEADVLSGFQMSQVPSEVARGFLTSIRVRYGIHVYMSRSRKDCLRFLLDSAIKYYKVAREVK